MNARRHLLPLLALPLVLAACGSQATSSGATGTQTSSTSGGVTHTATVNAAGELAAFAMVLEKDGAGPQLCLGGVRESYPPQCDGPAVVGWDWTKAPGWQEANGVRFGNFAVVGRWDGTRFTITRPPTTQELFKGKRPTEDITDFTTPCKAPDGGWKVVDPSRTSFEAMKRANEFAPTLPGYAGLWLDMPKPHPPAPSVTDSPDLPESTIINVAVTTDPAEAERRMREVWGGPLCIVTAQRTEAELLRIQEEIARGGSVLVSAPDVMKGRVNVTVRYDDGTLQREWDAKYGAGVVRVTSALFPYEPA